MNAMVGTEMDETMSKTPIRDELAVYLCDPSGEISIHGSPRDRLEVGKCLERVGVIERMLSTAYSILERYQSGPEGRELLELHAESLALMALIIGSSNMV